jgi:hypothetical protein
LGAEPPPPPPVAQNPGSATATNDMLHSARKTEQRGSQDQNRNRTRIFR